MPPVIPAPKLSPTLPNIITSPPVIYSHPLASHPSMTDIPPEFRTANLSPAFPAANSFPDVAPYKTVFPTIVFSFVLNLFSLEGLTTIVPPDKPLAT